MKQKPSFQDENENSKQDDKVEFDFFPINQVSKIFISISGKKQKDPKEDPKPEDQKENSKQ